MLCMRTYFSNLAVVMALFVVALSFLQPVSLTGNVVEAYEHPYRNLDQKEVHTCRDRTTIGIGLVYVMDYVEEVDSKHMRTRYVPDLCIDKKTVKIFGCKNDKKTHMLITSTVDCAEQGGTCHKGACTYQKTFKM
jgi:hypothetical protein